MAEHQGARNLDGDLSKVFEEAVPPKHEHCPTVAIKNATRQALYEAHMAPISDGHDARGDDHPVLLMADMSASRPASKKRTNRKSR